MSEIDDVALQGGIKQYLSELLTQEHIAILTGDLEHFYLNTPTFGKEAGVIETISKLMETTGKISEYVNVSEFSVALKFFIKDCLNLELVEGS